MKCENCHSQDAYLAGVLPISEDVEILPGVTVPGIYCPDCNIFVTVDLPINNNECGDEVI